MIVFVEVRQRSRQDYGSAAETIGPQKLQRLRRTAELFLLRLHGTTDVACRFDAVLLIGTQASHTLQHLEGIS